MLLSASISIYKPGTKSKISLLNKHQTGSKSLYGEKKKGIAFYLTGDLQTYCN